MKKRFLQLKKRQEEILKNNDPAVVARHLITLLNNQGYSTKGYENVGESHYIDIWIHRGLEHPLKIQNMAQGWEIHENPTPPPTVQSTKPTTMEDLPF